MILLYMGSYIGYIRTLARTTIRYVYDGRTKEVPFTTSSGDIPECEYADFTKAKEAHIRKWSGRMYSDSFLEQEYRWDPDEP